MLNEWVKKNRKQGKRKGITLVEVLVVIVILAVLTVSLSAKIGSYFDKPKELRVLNDMSYVRDSVILANGTNGLKSYGTLTANALAAGETTVVVNKLNEVLDPSLALKKATATETIETGAKDPWGKTYKITMIGPGSTPTVPVAAGALSGFAMTSYGPDGATGGGDDYTMTMYLDANGVLAVDYGTLPGQ